MDCPRCREPNRPAVRWCSLCGQVLADPAAPLSALDALAAADQARVARAVARQTPSPWLVVLATLLLGWTGVPRMLIGEDATGLVLTLVGGAAALGAVMLRVGGHPAAPPLAGVLLLLWAFSALTTRGAYRRSVAHARRAALLEVAAGAGPTTAARPSR